MRIEPQRLADASEGEEPAPVIGPEPCFRLAYQAMPPAVRELALLQAQRTAFGVMGALVEAMGEGTVRPIDPLIAAHLILSSINAAHELRGWRHGQSIDEAIATYETVLGEGLFDPE